MFGNASIVTMVTGAWMAALITMKEEQQILLKAFLRESSYMNEDSLKFACAHRCLNTSYKTMETRAISQTQLLYLKALREKQWSEFFERCIYKDASERLKDMQEIKHPVEYENRDHYSNKVPREHASSPWEEQLIDQIENVLNSKLNCVFLYREKTNFFCDRKTYEVADEIFKDELRKLRKFCSKQDIGQYLRLCLKPKKNIGEYIDIHLRSDLKTFIKNQRKFMDHKIQLRMWNEKAKAEWERLVEIFPDEDVIKYLIHCLK